jgi:mono/diheme cytochrome c family protein
MLKNLFFTGIAAAALVSAGYARQSNQKVVIPVSKTAANDGRSNFVSYCAPCHGTDGKGSGPVAAALKQQPVDLTLLTKNNAGKFPALHIESVLQGGSSIASHGTREMPVWGPVFATMDQGSTQEKTIRISNLVAFLRTIQSN